MNGIKSICIHVRHRRKRMCHTSKQQATANCRRPHTSSLHSIPGQQFHEALITKECQQVWKPGIFLSVCLSYHEASTWACNSPLRTCVCDICVCVCICARKSVFALVSYLHVVSSSERTWVRGSHRSFLVLEQRACFSASSPIARG